MMQKPIDVLLFARRKIVEAPYATAELQNRLTQIRADEPRAARHQK